MFFIALPLQTSSSSPLYHHECCKTHASRISPRFGESEGTPSEAGLHLDAMAALDFIHGSTVRPRVVIYGQSLGTGVAVNLARALCCEPERDKDKVPEGLILDSPFTSLPEAAQHHFLAGPLVWLIGMLSTKLKDTLLSKVPDRFETEKIIGRVTCPILIVHKVRDEVKWRSFRH